VRSDEEGCEKREREGRAGSGRTLDSGSNPWDN